MENRSLLELFLPKGLKGFRVLERLLVLGTQKDHILIVPLKLHELAVEEPAGRVAPQAVVPGKARVLVGDRQARGEDRVPRRLPHHAR